MFGRYRIGIMTHSSTDACAYYRSVNPFVTLSRQMPDVTIEVMQAISWATLAPLDVVFFQRAYSAEDLKIVQLVKMNRKKLWLDFDDLLDHVPDFNPASKLYNIPENKEAFKQIIALGDVVTVSTEALAEYVKQYNDNVHVIPNGFDDTMFVLGEDQYHPRNPVCLIRGTASHVRDHDMVKTGTLQMVKDFPNVKFVYWGFMPDFWKNKVPANIKCLPGTDIVQYHDILKNMRPMIMPVPLEDTKFNRAKSSCAWLEASYAGAVVVCPSWEEWDKQGVLQYNNADEYISQIRRAFTMTSSELGKMNDKAVTQISSTYRLSQINKKRYSLLMKLAS